MVAGADEVDGGGGEVFTGAELGEGAAGFVDYCVAFQVALDAGAVAFGGRQFVGVEDGAVPALSEVGCGVSVAGAAAYAALAEGLGGEAVAGGWEGGLDVGGVAVEAVGVGGEDGGHGGYGVEGGGHVPGVAAGVGVDGELEPLGVGAVEIGAASAAGAYEVEEFAFAAEGWVSVAGE